MNDYIKRDRSPIRGSREQAFYCDALLTIVFLWKVTERTEEQAAAQNFFPEHFSTLNLVMLSPSLNGQKNIWPPNNVRTQKQFCSEYIQQGAQVRCIFRMQYSEILFELRPQSKVKLLSNLSKRSFYDCFYAQCFVWRAWNDRTNFILSLLPLTGYWISSYKVTSVVSGQWQLER